METLDQSEMVVNQNIVTSAVLRNMNGTSPWMLTMGVMFIILALFMELIGITVFIKADIYSSFGLMGAMQVMAGYYILSGCMFAYSGYLLLNSGAKAGTFAKYPSATLLEHYTEKQKYFWMVMGVNAIVTIIFMVVFVVMAGKLASLATAA